MRREESISGKRQPVVLVVDDDTAIRDALAMVLEGHGIQCLEAGNGAHALTLLRGQEIRPDMIVLDLMMPVMSGQQFRRAQLADEWLAAIPTVVLSAAGDLPTADLQVKHTLRKPIDLGGLLTLIRQHVAGVQ